MLELLQAKMLRIAITHYSYTFFQVHGWSKNIMGKLTHVPLTLAAVFKLYTHHLPSQKIRALNQNYYCLLLSESIVAILSEIVVKMSEMQENVLKIAG